VTDGASEARALRPLWLLTTGAAVGAVSALTAIEPPPGLPSALLLTGCAAVVAALTRKGRTRPGLWLLAGLAIVSGRGLGQVEHALELARIVADGETSVRARAVLIEGWTDSRWGLRTRARILSARHRERELWLPRIGRLEIRGLADRTSLPRAGAEVEILARIRGSPRNPLLVVSSGRLVRATGDRRLLPTVRDHLASQLFRAAGTNVNRIRAAQMASALALGRRDLVPGERREGWRRSGLAHLLAVSGLHVGLVGGAAWLVLALAGASPRATRATVLVALPAYAVLAGAAPSALRAALMAVIYLGARLLGRAILPMAAVLLAATLLLVIQPSLIANAGFQLTVVITAALVRWVPPLTELLVGPRWLSGALAVPLVAQATAAPIVAWHFRALIPGAVIANLCALPLLAPTILGSVLATVMAPLWAAPAALVLDLVAGLLSILRSISGAARAVEVVTPPIPVVVTAFLAVFGWLALQAGRRARVGVAAWFLMLVGATVFWHLHRPGDRPTVELLPVSDGAAVVIIAGSDAVLADGGRYRQESARLLAESCRRRLRAVIMSHTDEDHIGGIGQVLRSVEVENLVMPEWMVSDEEVVPLLRLARRRGVRIRLVGSGSSLSFGRVDVDVLWPPFRDPPRIENERSLVARARLEAGTVLLTADIGRTTEIRLARTLHLQSAILIVPHHGGRNSTSLTLVEAASPSVALIPAAPGNTHGHPHSEVLRRLTERHIPVRYPARDGWCGARWNGEEWIPYP
jgi:competence protein ComEC